MALRQIALLLVIALGLAGLAPVAAHAVAPNVLVIGEDADPDTLRRGSRVFKRVEAAITNELVSRGFSVLDETAVTLGRLTRDRVRRRDSEIIDVARTIARPPVDVAVIFSVWAHAERLRYTTRIDVRLTGRLLDVATGQRLGNFEVELPRPPRVAKECRRPCMMEAVGDAAKQLAHELGVSVAYRLRALADGSAEPGRPPHGYTLVFEGFERTDVALMEEFFIDFAGYAGHRSVSTDRYRAEYWYDTYSAYGTLNSNIQLLLDHLDLSGRIRSSGNMIQVQRTGG